MNRSKFLLSFLFLVVVVFAFSSIEAETNPKIYPSMCVEITEVTADEILIESVEPELIEYPDHWTCFEFAINYSELHPDYGMVVISTHPQFQSRDNHIVNYIINDDKSLQIISYVNQPDGSYEVIEYTLGGWQYDLDTFTYYHFYINDEIPTKYYNSLRPNAEEVYNEL